MQVNRYLKDKKMDYIDHALGRPVDPLQDTYRNRFAADAGSAEFNHMVQSSHWKFTGTIPGGLKMFEVTSAGRKALAAHLKRIGDKHRLYSVEWGGLEMTQVGTSRSNARYLKWLSVSDTADVPFKDFAATARVRLAT